MKKFVGLVFFCAGVCWGQGDLQAQTSIIQGTVSDAVNNEGLALATVTVQGSAKATATDLDGNYQLEGLEPGLYNVEFKMFGYESFVAFEVSVTNNKPARLDARLSASTTKLTEIEVSAQNRFERNPESPVSVQNIGINEIQRNPGGNQDISKVVQSLPGVAAQPGFRNDLIIRGGAPNENRFYLDGIEIPAINHFATQGSSGGPVGMINVNFLREVNLYTGAFPVERGNALSSVMELQLKDARTDRWGGIGQVGASEVGITVDGPLGDKTGLMLSARRSYLQFLFSLLELPFLPTYNDFQVKLKHTFNRKHQITFLGLGAVDNFDLNLNANETEAQRYTLNALPVNEQWNYSVGAKYTYFAEKSYTNVVLSQFMLNNTAFKYVDNDESKTQLLDYDSREIENKLRVENFYRHNGWRWTNGFGFEELKYATDELDLRVPEGQPARSYTTNLRMFRYSLFSQATKTVWREHLTLSAGFRMDALSFNVSTRNPLEQLSPRLSASYALNSNWSLNANWGIYYQLPPYTLLGFRDQSGDLVNRDATYIRSTHTVVGVTNYLPFNAKWSLEAFYKDYGNYPFLLTDSISLANLGGDFGVIGNAPSRSVSEGRSYGLELTYQQKYYKGFFGILALTLVRSEFEDKKGVLVPTAWDNRIIGTLTAGKRFGKNWELGVQYQFLGGAPFTPFDLDESALIVNWDNIGFGIPDYDALNTQRFDNFNRINARIDKKWFFPKWSLDVYFDVQNLLGQAVQGPPLVDVQRDAMGAPIVDPNDPNRYLIKELENSSGSTLPSIGLIIEI
ncbi:TonB-dependent receptor plug domain-containing protein [bacterium]|nr:TonB-dependent receptor plug domain-containing protein [bacterium]